MLDNKSNSEETNDVKTVEFKYSTNDKKNLKEKILKLSKYKNRSHILFVAKIVLKSTDNYSTNSNGIFTIINNLSDDAYDEINNYIVKLEKNRSRMLIKNLTSDISDTIIDSDNLMKNSKISDSGINIEVDTEKYLTNKEKVIMRRKNYEKYLEKNQE